MRMPPPGPAPGALRAPGVRFSLYYRASVREEPNPRERQLRTPRTLTAVTAMERERNKRMRELWAPGRGTLIPGAGNALAARIMASVGFEAVLFTGAGFANSYLGVPDMGFTSVKEVVDQVAAMRDAVEIPILADADTGFGNALNVRRTVRMMERAGANAILIEDQVFPKRCGHFENKSVIPKAEMVQKIKAAVDARTSDMLLLARTDARAVEGLDAALERAAAYQEAGAELLFVEAPTSIEELARIPKAVPGSHLCNMVYGGKTPIPSQRQLQAMGFAAIAYANAALQASMLAMQRVMRHLREHGSLDGVEAALIAFDDRQKFVDYPRYVELEKRYTGA
jgi:2-methylisocitrate lyase-like PEP mutase family enzyme